MNHHRISYFDIAKGIGMICVILGHLSVAKINMVVFTFHMPLFFLISGYFIRKQEPKVLAKRRFCQLMIPYAVTCIILLLLSPFVDIALGRSEEIVKNLGLWLYASLYGSGNTYTEPFYIKQIGALWFLPAMYLSTIIYNGLMDKKRCSLAVISLAFIGYITVKIVYLPMSIQSAMFALVFIHIGHLFRVNNILDGDKEKIIFPIALIIWLLCMYLDQGRFYLVGNYSENLFVDVTGAVAGCYVIIILSRFLENVPMLSLGLRWFGENSLLILCFHLVELTFFPWKLLCHVLGIENYYLSDCFIIAGKIFWSTTCTIVVLKVPFLSNLFQIGKKVR